MRSELALLIARLDCLGRSADALCETLEAEGSESHALCEFGSACSALGAVGTEPCVDVQLCVAGEAVERLALARASAVDLQRQVCATSYSFLGRYAQSAQAAAETHRAAKQARESAARTLLQRDADLRRVSDRYPAESVELFRATEEHRAAALTDLEASEAEALSLERLQDDVRTLAAYRVSMMRSVLTSLLEARQAAARDSADAWESLRNQLVGAHFNKDEVKSIPPPRPPAPGDRLDNLDGVDGALQRAIAASLEGGGAGFTATSGDLVAASEAQPVSVPAPAAEAAAAATTTATATTAAAAEGGGGGEDQLTLQEEGGGEGESTPPPAVFDPDNPLA